MRALVINKCYPVIELPHYRTLGLLVDVDDLLSNSVSVVVR